MWAHGQDGRADAHFRPRSCGPPARHEAGPGCTHQPVDERHAGGLLELARREALAAEGAREAHLAVAVRLEHLVDTGAVCSRVRGGG